MFCYVWFGLVLYTCCSDTVFILNILSQFLVPLVRVELSRSWYHNYISHNRNCANRTSNDILSEPVFFYSNRSIKQMANALISYYRSTKQSFFTFIMKLSRVNISLTVTNFICDALHFEPERLQCQINHTQNIPTKFYCWEIFINMKYKQEKTYFYFLLLIRMSSAIFIETLKTSNKSRGKITF